MRIIIVTVSTSAIETLIGVAEQFKNRYPGALELGLYYAARAMTPDRAGRMTSAIAGADAVLVDLMGTPGPIVEQVEAALSQCRGQIIPYGRSGRHFLRLGQLTAQSMASEGSMKMTPEAMKKMAGMAEKMGKLVPIGKVRDIANLSQITKYFRVADEFNITQMLLLLLRDYGGRTGLPAPQPAREIPEVGICRPSDRKYYDRYTDYMAENGFDPALPIVALLFYGHTYPNDTAGCVDEIARRVGAFANILPIAFSGTGARDLNRIKGWLSDAGGKKAALIVNFMSFRLGAGPMGGDADAAIAMLEQIGAPCLHPFFMSRRREEEWRQSPQGINPSEFMLSVMLPELDGCVETFPVGAMDEPVRHEGYDAEIRRIRIIEERADHLAARIRRRLALAHKPNDRKKVAILCYNYPPGEDNLFGGAFLDTLASVENILSTLSAEGYKTSPCSAESLKNQFLSEGLVNSARYRYAGGDMIRWREAHAIQDEQIITHWGPAPGDIMAEEGQYLIPGIIRDHVFIGLQPSRGIHEHSDKAYHDKALPPHHQYAAFYRWLRDEFKADAVIHVGTHGTLEFLPGKECGMSQDCWPDRLMADMPHFYLYYAGNPSEAMIAKRRSHAEIISYQPPEFVQGDLYGEYVALSALIDEYREAQRVSPARCTALLDDIGEKARQLNLSADLDELEKELYRMNRSLIPKGLHVFGRAYTHREAASYVKGLLRYDRDEIRSLQGILSESNTGFAPDKADGLASWLVDEFLADGKIPQAPWLTPELHSQCEQTLRYGKQRYEQCMENAESEGLLAALSGRYHRARLAGDIFRNPEVLPAGYNLYQFDPRFIPSQTACRRGWEIAENTLDQYRREQGTLPSSTAVILWGLETSRTCGETVAQILAYLGVQPVSGKNAWEPHFELIPLEELGRKRVDVVVHICGFFRDMFGNIIDSLNDIFAMVAQADEPLEMNGLKANAQRIYHHLLDQGYEPHEAAELSRSRVFGPAEAQYGTGITSIIETKNWEQESSLGQQFIHQLRHVYSASYRGRDVEGLLEDNLRCVEVVSQIRSSHEYEITDLDHYYEFFGGLAKSVENVRGTKAAMYITDTTGETVETETVDKSIARGVRTRLLNPKWIDGMLEHPYHGVQKIADRFENIMGLAATTNRVDQWIYNDLHERYVEDETLRERMSQNNRYAYLTILEQMMEYDKRGYWDATQQQRDQLTRAYLALEETIEGGEA